MREEEIMTSIILFRRPTKTELRYNTGNRKPNQTDHSIISPLFFAVQGDVRRPRWQGNKHFDKSGALDFRDMLVQQNPRLAFVVLAFLMLIYHGWKTKP